LTRCSNWDLVELEVAAVTLGHVDRNIVSVQSREQNSVDGGRGSDQTTSNGILLRVREGDGGRTSSVRVLRRLDSERWESFKWQFCGVTGSEAGDELCGEGVDLVEVQWGVEGLWERRLLEGSADVGGVAGFNCEYRSSDCEISFVQDLSGSA